VNRENSIVGKFARGSIAVVMIVIAAMSPAVACRGGTVLLKDEFAKSNSAWSKPSGWDVTFTIAGGKLQAKAPPQKWGMVTYGPSFFPEADVCVDMALPAVSDPKNKWAGLLFEGADGNYVAAINFDRTVVVYKVNSDGWFEAYPKTEARLVKGGANALNRIRLAWKAEPIVSFYLNNQLFDTFDARTNRNRRIGFGFQTGGDTVEFRNLLVTK
jgi:hypothetical protein